MTTTYYAPLSHHSDGRIVLPKEEARHAVQVLRSAVGDEIVCVDGTGGWYRVVLDAVDKKNVVGRVLERREEVGESELSVTIAVGVLKNAKRFEVFVEKACELGVTRIIPIQTKRTEKSKVRPDRLTKILIAAMKQCGRSRLVEVEEVTRFSDLLEDRRFDQKLICHEKAGKENNLIAALDSSSDKDIVIVIGPEGGFSEEEITNANAKGFTPVYLGNRRLRAETAAITACAGVMLAKETKQSTYH